MRGRRRTRHFDERRPVAGRYGRRPFLDHVKSRPVYAHVAKDNVASIRVLQKCRFEISGEGKEFSNARGEEVEELILQLRAGAASPQEGAQS